MNEEAYKPRQRWFRYSGVERYIRIIERQPKETAVEECLILDEKLSVVCKQLGHIINIDNEGPKQQVDRVTYDISSIKKTYFYEKRYLSYPLLNDFIIGRANWGRNMLTLKLNSDSISREHTKIVCHTLMSDKEQILNCLKAAIRENTRISSRWRKIGSELCDKIVSYIVRKPYYTVEDRDSRNGTYIEDTSSIVKQLKEEQVYEFEEMSCSLKVLVCSRMSGQQFRQRLKQEQQIQKKQNSGNAYHLGVALPTGTVLEQLESNTIFYVLQFELNDIWQHKFIHWIVNNDCQTQYPIGLGELLYFNQVGDMYGSMKIGNITFKEKKWLLAPTFNHGIWYKLPPFKPYTLSQKPSKIRIAHYAQLEVSFHNFK